ncbi:hypothetical protein J2Z69_000721 [Paenibacillus shirakamiensis]|uniref:Uncharacterized protein n=1 Tax=Paenibacillus shirakamiensis TaxID=1265935 RepID=A0ABS4JDA8_9BACL|nr:hypothetical protein [Paenibacillus shirakamiensis]
MSDEKVKKLYEIYSKEVDRLFNISRRTRKNRVSQNYLIELSDLRKNTIGHMTRFIFGD